MTDRTKKYKLGLEYLKKSGFDLPVIPTFARLVYKEHSYFDEKKQNLPKPYKIAGNVLSADFMNHYSIITKVDLARYLRIVAIILAHFQGPKDNDHLDFHIFALQ